MLESLTEVWISVSQAAFPAMGIVCVHCMHCVRDLLHLPCCPTHLMLAPSAVPIRSLALLKTLLLLPPCLLELQVVAQRAGCAPGKVPMEALKVPSEICFLSHRGPQGFLSALGVQSFYGILYRPVLHLEGASSCFECPPPLRNATIKCSHHGIGPMSLTSGKCHSYAHLQEDEHD